VIPTPKGAIYCAYLKRMFIKNDHPEVAKDGTEDGIEEGNTLDTGDGTADGAANGDEVGTEEGTTVSAEDGTEEGAEDGITLVHDETEEETVPTETDGKFHIGGHLIQRERERKTRRNRERVTERKIDREQV